MSDPIYTAITRALADGDIVALVTIVSARGSTPQRVGAKMLVFADGHILGTIGGGCYENDALGKARTVIETGRPELVRYELADEFAEESGLICGGQMEVFIEAIEPPPDLFIMGAGHVGFHLARLAANVGFRVHVVDDREKFANAQRFPEATEIIVDDLPTWLEARIFTKRAYAVIVTRGHRHDLSGLRALASQPLRYVGLIGSRAKVAKIFDALLEEGISPDWLRQVHAPIGLDIGAVTPEEIAVSIVAELIAARRGRTSDASSMRWNRIPAPS